LICNGGTFAYQVAKLVLNARTELAHGARYFAAARAACRLLFADDGVYSVFDRELTLMASGVLPPGAVAMSPTASVLGVGAKTEWLFCDAHGSVLARHLHREHKSWESASLSFLDETRVVTAEPEGAGVLLQCMFWATGAVQHALRIPLPATGRHHLYVHPSEQAWILWNAAGQEGQWSYRITLDERGFQALELDDVGATEHGPPAFTPDGSAYAVVTEDGITQWSWSDNAFQFCVPHEEDARPSWVQPINASQLLVLDDEHSNLWLINQDGQRAVIDLAKLDKPSLGRLWSMESLADGRVLTVHGNPTGGAQIISVYAVELGGP
jgi:hypothetical protein